MASSDSTLQVNLSARTAELQAGMEAASSAVSSACNQMTASLTKLGAEGSRGPREVNRAVEETPTIFARANEAVEGFKASLESIGKVAIIGLVIELANKIRELVGETLESGAALEHMSQRTGISAGNLAAMQKVAQLAGVSMEGFERSTRQVSLKLVEAENGSKSAAGAFAAFHLSLSDLKGLNPEQLFDKIADACARTKDGVEKTGAAAQLLGSRMGTQLIPLMNQGSGAIHRLEGDFKTLGTTTDKQAEDFEQAKIGIETLVTAAESLGRAIVGGIGPAIKMWSDSMTGNIFMIEMLGELVGDLASWLWSKLQPAVSAITRILHPFTQAIKAAGAAVADFFGSSIRSVGGGGALDDIQKRFEEFQKKIKAAQDIGAVSASLSGGGQGDEGIGAGYNTGAAKAIKDKLTAFTDEIHLEEAEKEKDVAFKVAAERRIYDETVKLYGAQSNEARKAAVDVQHAMNEQIAETQRLRLDDLQQSQSIAEKRTQGEIQQIKAAAAAQQEQLRTALRLKQVSAADEKAAQLKIAQSETDALSEAARIQYANKQDALDKELAILRQHDVLNVEEIKKVQTQITESQIEFQNQLAAIEQKGATDRAKIEADALVKSQEQWKQATTKITDNVERMFDQILSATGKGQDRVSVLMKKWLLSIGKDAGFAAIFGGAQGSLGAAAFGSKGQGGGAVGALIGGGAGAGGLVGKLFGPAVSSQIQGLLTGGGSGGGLVGMLFGAGASIIGKVLGGTTSQKTTNGGAGAQAANGGLNVATQLAASAAKELIAKVVQTTTLSTVFATTQTTNTAVIGAALAVTNTLLGQILAIDTANLFMNSAAAPKPLGLAGGGIVPSAAGGMVVGKSNGNGVPSILHPKEMVLPAYLSEGFQQMLGKGEGASHQIHAHFNVSSMDSEDVERFFDKHQDKIVTSLQRAARGRNMEF